VALDLGGIRVVHACWHEASIDLVCERLAGKTMDDAFLHEAFTRDTPVWKAMERLAKGPEARVPGDWFSENRKGHRRTEVRLQWWLEKASASFAESALLGDYRAASPLPETAVPAELMSPPSDGAPVFVGHYWMTGTPRRMTRRVACVDWSAAADGFLVAYRWDGETEIDERKFVAAA
jgi:hypothetical protein